MGSALSSGAGDTEPSQPQAQQDYASNNPNRYRNPLHEIGQMLEPIAVRLAWAEEAIAAGADPNALEEDPRWETNRHRPLHAALDHPGDRDAYTGQDPRLEGQIIPSEQGRRFYEEAAKILEEAENKLNEKDKSDVATEKPPRDTQPVECLFCREDKKHNWHYWCYKGTKQERRTFEAVDNTVKAAKS
ncbi:hypothetical protein NM208_g7392 [Fusarium decemcellulare]|uniref:Uncharacterized protein n=1 Tax=Fusarium decemcellulare TaxID=57161 RepID=A0ACC1S9F0_9HYPO|nr:hypothetical protein NM208_g7392 [Fusarium decemcellulare]